MNFVSWLHLSNINAGDIRELKAQTSSLWDWEDSAPARGGRRGMKLWASLVLAAGFSSWLLLVFGGSEVRPGRWEALTQGFGLEFSLSNTRKQPVLGVPMGWGTGLKAPAMGKSLPEPPSTLQLNPSTA